jgi:hypothetical protein
MTGTRFKLNYNLRFLFSYFLGMHRTRVQTGKPGFGVPGYGTTPYRDSRVHVFIGMKTSEQEIFNRDSRLRVVPNPGSSGSVNA